jgi:hypothetical protein
MANANVRSTCMLRAILVFSALASGLLVSGLARAQCLDYGATLHWLAGVDTPGTPTPSP